jgi:hypothetical protein
LLHRPVFWQTRTGLAIGSAGSRVDPPDRSGFNNYAQDNSPSFSGPPEEPKIKKSPRTPLASVSKI